MTINQAERRKMLAVRLCGPRVLARLESIGVERLSDLTGRAADELVGEVNIEAGRPIWHPPVATEAMSNLIAAAEFPCSTASRGASPLTGATGRPHTAWRGT